MAVEHRRQICRHRQPAVRGLSVNRGGHCDEAPQTAALQCGEVDAGEAPRVFFERERKILPIARRADLAADGDGECVNGGVVQYFHRPLLFLLLRKRLLSGRIKTSCGVRRGCRGLERRQMWGGWRQRRGGGRRRRSDGEVNIWELVAVDIVNNFHKRPNTRRNGVESPAFYKRRLASWGATATAGRRRTRHFFILFLSNRAVCLMICFFFPCRDVSVLSVVRN